MSSWIIVIIIFIAVGVVFTTYYNYKFRKKLDKIKSQREPLTRIQFRLLMLDKGYDKTRIEVIYDIVQEYLLSDGFSIYPEDDLISLYQMDDMDFTTMLDEISKELEVRELTQNDIDKFEELNNIFSIENILKLYQSMV